MRRLIACLTFSLCGFCMAAESVSVDAFDFQSIEVGTAISLYLKEVSKRPYMLCSDVLSDTRKVSIRASGKMLTGPLFASLLADHGFESVDKGGVLVVCKKGAAVDAETDAFLYRVKHRDSAYLVDLVSPLIKGVFANKRSGDGGALTVGGEKEAVGPMPATNAPAVAISSTFKASGDDYILFSGTSSETAKLQKLLAQVDVATGEVIMKAYMYEVGSTESESSALGLVMSILGGKIQIGIASSVGNDFLRLSTSSIDLVASALKSDGRFKIVTAPYQRVRSGKTARFVSGSQVSVLGAIVNNQNGSTQQSYDRIESGTILEVSPVVRADGVDVDLFQQVSSFVTTTGSAQPTLNKRELRTSLTVQDGEVVVIAGLEDAKEDAGRSGLPFLPFSLSKNKSKSTSQLILVLELKRL